MLEKLAENASLIQAGLLGIISVLIGVVAYFVKKTYDKADGLDQKFLDNKVEGLDLVKKFAEHQAETSLAIIAARHQFSETINKVEKIAIDIRDDVVTCMEVVKTNQNAIVAHGKALDLAKHIYQNHNDRIRNSESKIQKIGEDILLIKGPKKAR